MKGYAPPGSPAHWVRYDLAQMWEMVRDEDSEVNYRQRAAWLRMADLCTDQADQLSKALAQLVSRWPNRPGSASSALVNRLTPMIRSMREQADAAKNNARALENITNVLVAARSEIGALMDEARHLAGVERQLQPQRTPSPGEAQAPTPFVSLTPPPHDWRERINDQAREVMRRTDEMIAPELHTITVPKRYDPQPGHDDGTEPPKPPPPPPPVGGGSSWVSPIPPLAFDPPEPLPLPTGPGLSWGSDGDPVLASGPGLAGAGLGGPGSVFAPGGSGYSSRVDTPIGSALAPGGLIGGPPPGVGSGPSVGTRAGQTPPPGTSGAGTRAGGPAGGAPMGAPMAPPPRQAGTPHHIPPAGRRATPHWRNRTTRDPHDPWAVPDGVPALIEPVTDTTDHDPGPHIGPRP